MQRSSGASPDLQQAQAGSFQWWKGKGILGPTALCAAWQALGRWSRASRGRRSGPRDIEPPPGDWGEVEEFAIPWPVDQLARWLLEFAARDLAGLAQAGWRRLLHVELPEFMGPIFITRGHGPAEVGPRLKARIRAEQRWLRQGLVSLAETGTWQLPHTAQRPRVLRVGRAGLVPYGEAPLVPFWAAFRRAVFDVLEKVGGRFRSCPECGRPFIRRKRQGYCSLGCSQSVRTRKYRQADPERFRAQRRAAYLEAVRKKTGHGKLRIGRQSGLRRRSFG